METTSQHVTILTVPTVNYDGTAHCEICDTQISYITGNHPVPTHCASCMMNCRNRLGGTFDRAGDGWREREQPDVVAEKTIGDSTVAVVHVGGLNGPYSIQVFGGGSPRTLACRFETVDDARRYLASVSSRDLIERRGQ